MQIQTPEIPSEILESYYPDGVSGQAEIKGGEVNTTLLVTDNNGNRSILQRLSGIYDAVIGEDYETVARHLTDEGWEMAAVLRANDGTAYLSDGSGQLWRSFNYIESEPGSSYEGDLEATAALGGLLGTLHRSLATLDYRPKFTIPHSQDTHYFANRLREISSQIPDEAGRELAEEMIELSQEGVIDIKSLQLIHGDPRISNAFFREGKPFTFIDWDGLKLGSPLLDIGDLLQSTAGEVITKDKGSCTVAELQPILEAYHSEARVGTDKQVFGRDALITARIIALNLGMRHLIDTVENRYFKWDPARFKSKLDFNLFCIRRQQKVYSIFET